MTLRFGLNSISASGGGGSSVTVDSALSHTSTNPVQNRVITDSIIIKSETMPTASSDNVGEIRQYLGNTTSSYTHGYVYECQEDNNVYNWVRIDVQPGGSRGRFLALWNCSTGLSESNPPYSPYPYSTGDYFIVGTVGTTNYKPSGSSYTTGVASTTVETADVKVDDTYYYDGTNWRLQRNTEASLSAGTNITIANNEISTSAAQVILRRL